jgi:hypothetical protein
VQRAAAGRSNRRTLAAAVTMLVLALVGAAGTAGSAAAATLPATCSTLGSQLTAANPGDTIVLTGLCTGGNASFTLPTTANLVIEGAPTGTNGFDGTGVATPALTSPGGGSQGLTLQDLTFQDYTSSSAVHITETGAPGDPVTVSGDTFSGDGSSSVSAGGGLYLDFVPDTCSFGASPAVTVANSVFSGDTADFNGGGAELILGCGAGATTFPASITGNVFSHDQVTDTVGGAFGGGLSVIAQFIPIGLTQQDNLFESDSAIATNPPTDLAGGGEYTAGANITSVGDQFINDSLAGPTTSATWSWGAGLATFGGGECIETGATSQFTNLVAAGNSIGAPSGSATGADATGAGIYAGCLGAPDLGYDLTLINSTVSGNTVSGTGAVAGVDGQSGDTLNLENTIVDGDSGGAELGGFGTTTAANVTATYSDVCAVAAEVPGDAPSTPFAGTGNICAAPALAAAATGDVHETSASPTIDAGSNPLVPAGVTTDVYGNPRIVPRVTGQTATVDIGAAEFPSVAPPATTPVNVTPPVVTGIQAVGATLTCSTGTWTGDPTSFTYTWSRDGTPIAGATHSTYTVQSIDAGQTLTCTVSAGNGAGTAAGVASRQVPVPVPSRAGCPTATGSVHGATLGLVTLGDTRAQATRHYLRSATRGHHYQQFFCLTPIGVRVGYPAARLLTKLSARRRAALRGRVIWISTANPHYALDGIRPGATLKAARRRLHLGAVFSVGSNDWYFAAGASANELLKVRRGIVHEVGITNRSLTTGRAAQRRFLDSYQ